MGFLKTQSLVNSMILRCYGVDGRAESWPFVLKVLNSYFRRRKAPHCFVRKRTRQRRRASSDILGLSCALRKSRQKQRLRGPRFRLAAPVRWHPAKAIAQTVLSRLRLNDAREPSDLFPDAPSAAAHQQQRATVQKGSQRLLSTKTY